MNVALHLIEKAARDGRLAHLLLFHGGSSPERRKAGLEIAQRMNCTSDQEVPCGHCPSCKKILSGNHPDVEVVKPAKMSMGIEQVLDWQERVYRKHYEGKYKVFILEEADKLTIPAANALLKVIEEPPERTIIILSAQNAEVLLPTIQSRAQAVYFPFRGEKEWLESLDESIDSWEAQEAFRLSSHNPELAYEILTLGVEKVKAWTQGFEQAVEDGDFLKLFPLFPLEKKEAEIYLHILALGVAQKHEVNPQAMLAIGQAIDQIQMQANPRLVIEGLALHLFKV
ncbi:MAG TPA: DNA polymerase III subunit [Desulfitobacterium dehalogenans]|uniref:DNA polymerase III subunit n=1 Tax=Desulfitobacterium dehalogenans TaxID=36854 RepID=A0A7C7D897_9FIRM|nr:DNA polymerase III subunit [Desulfitobacterium dehalogenans]